MPPESLKDDDDLPEGGVNVEEENDTVVVLDDDEGTQKDKQDTKGKPAKDAGAEDERLGADPEAPTEEERERLREQRRLRRKNARQWIKRDRLELNFLRQQNEELEARLASVEKGQKVVSNQTQIGRIDNALTALQQRLDEVDGVIEAAVTESDGARVVQATRLRDELRDKIIQLNTHRTALKGGETAADERGGAQEDEVRNASKTAMSNARIFKSRNDWYDGKNKDSRVVNRIDTELRGEGLLPHTAAFWQELEKRAREEIPHRFEKGNDLEEGDEDDDDDEDDERQEQRGGDKPNAKAKGGPAITAIGAGNKGAGGKKTFTISRERKEAMVKAGIWDDVPLRNKMIRRYMAYDQQHGLRK